MAAQTVPINRIGANAKSTSSKQDTWFNPFDFSPGQDEHIRWLSRPNQQLTHSKYSHDVEKFRVTFDVENFQPDQIKIYIQNRKLTIKGVYEERTENRIVQKQFERNIDIPANADVDSMACFITPAHLLVVETPLNPSTQTDYLNTTNNQNDVRRLSFSLDKFNISNNQGLLLTSNDLSNSGIPGQQVRRTSVTKTITTTTTTTSGSNEVSPEAAELLRHADVTNDTTIQSHHTHTSNTANQPVPINQSNTSSVQSTTSNEQTLAKSSDLTNLPLQIPPELFTRGGTITIQTRRVSVTKETDENTDRAVNVPIKHDTDTKSTSSTITKSSVPSNSLNQHETGSSENRSSKTISNTTQRQMYTLEEFLQNKTWNPSLIDGPNGKKILYMRLQMKPGTTLDQMKILLDGYNLRVEVSNKGSNEDRGLITEHSYRQVTLFPTCEIDQLKTELKNDGFLHIQVPIKL